MNTYEVINIKGKEYPVAFNKYAIAKLLKALGISLNQLVEPDQSDELEMDLEYMQKIAYYGLVGGHAAKYEEEFPLSFIKVCLTLFEEMEVFSQIMEVWVLHTQPEPGESPKRTAKATKTVAKAKKS